MKLLVFTYAPAGLGHLRVTDALIASLPKDHPYELLGSDDPLMTRIHRFTSVNPLARKIYEAFQYGLLEDIITKFYVWYLRMNSGDVYKKMLQFIDEHSHAQELTVVATHFGLAHQIASIKNRVRKKTGVKIHIVVQVTDDTSQHVWCVRGADITFVPSKRTKDEILSYASRVGIRLNVEVSPYPNSPVLTKVLEEKNARAGVFVKNSDKVINVIVPISGAAVGLDYLAKLILEIDRLSKRFHFLVVAKRSGQTKNFLSKIGRARWVQLITGRNDNEVVGLYKQTYRENLIHIEITKPSEQSFKALIPPYMVGGSILLFTKAIGRQEYDNIFFLRRHRLVEDSDEGDLGTIESACAPRCVMLSKDPVEAARFVIKSLDTGLFERMTKDFSYSPQSMMTSEISEKGSWMFWETLRLMDLI